MTTIQDLRKLRREAALRDVRQGMFRRGITGRWNANGSLTASDEPGTIFVRIGATKAVDKRLATKCTNTEVDTRSNLRVILWMVDGEWDVFSIDPRERHRLGAAVGNAATVRRAGDLVEETVVGRRLKEGRLRVWQSGTLILNVDPFNYIDSAGALKRWVPTVANAVDVSSDVPAAVAGVDQGCWVRFALDPDAGAPALKVNTGLPINALLYDANGWLDIAVNDGCIPLDSVWLQTGDSTIGDDARYAFSRLLLNPLALTDSVNLPDSSTDNAIVRWDGAGGDTIQDSIPTIDDGGNLNMQGAEIQDYAEAVVATSESSSYDVDWSSGSLFEIALTGDVTLAFSSVSAGRSITLILIQDGTGGRSVTFPVAVHWVNGAPTLQSDADAIDVITLLVRADGATVEGFSAVGSSTVQVSGNDTAAGYLSDKLAAGQHITLTETDDGGNETVTIGALEILVDDDGNILFDDTPDVLYEAA